ncbi:MAG: EAL domain-containing protein [Pseudomonadota bacterium]
MATRLTLIGLFGIAIVGAGLWYSPAPLGLVLEALAIMQSSGLYVLAATFVIVFVLAFLSFRAAANARNRKRELDEYMRVAQQTASVQPQSFKKNPAEAEADNELAPEDNPPTTVQEPPQLSVIAGGKSKKKRASGEIELSSISDELYFQPVTKMPDGQIAGYEVYRQAIPVSRQVPIFVQSNPSASKEEQAEFEFSTLEKAAAATGQEIWTDIAETSRIRFFVQISDALLDDKLLWRRAGSILKKQTNSNPTIALVVHSSAFADTAQKLSKGRMQKLQRLHNAGVPLALYGFQHDHQLVTEALIDCFDVSICDKETLLGYRANSATADLPKAFEQIDNSSLMTSVRGIASEADVVDCIAAGVKLMSGDYLAPPRKLKSEESIGSDAAE